MNTAKPHEGAGVSLEKAVLDYRNGNWINALKGLNEFMDEYGDGDKSPQQKAYCAEALMILGSIHTSFYDYVNAETYFLKSLEYAEQTGDSTIAMNDCFNLAVVYAMTDNKEKAYDYLRKGLSLDVEDRKLQKIIFINTDGFLERKFGNWHMAADKMRHALKEIDTISKYGVKRSTALSELTEMYEEHNKLDSAYYYMDQYSRVAEEYNIPDMVTDCMRLKMKVFTRLGSVDSAIYYQNKYFSFRDSLFNTSNFHTIVANIHKNQETLNNLRIEYMEAKMHRRNTAILILIIFIIVAAFVVGWIIRQNRRLKQSYIKLYEKNEQLNKLTSVPVHSADTDSEPENTPLPDSETLYPGLKIKILKVMNETEEWLDPSFSLNRLAQLTGSNTHYVSQVINQDLKMNFRSFVNSYRIRKACEMMADKNLKQVPTIISISESLGFRSVTSFNTAFKKHTGLTPAFYQKMAAAKEEGTS